MNGKGDRNRTANFGKFRRNFGDINWSKFRFEILSDAEALRYDIKNGKYVRVKFRGENPHNRKVSNDTKKKTKLV